jgi:hypothetical protein
MKYCRREKIGGRLKETVGGVGGRWEEGRVRGENPEARGRKEEEKEGQDNVLGEKRGGSR